MAHINHKPSKYMLNLLHVLDPFTNEKKGIVNAIIEISAGSINKYELITESGQLKLDRVGYSSMAYPYTYGAIPRTWDIDNDPLDIVLTNITEPLIPGSLVEARIVGGIKFIDNGEIDDKIIAVLADDKRVDHVKEIDDLGTYFKTQSKYFWENYKALKKSNTGVVEKFLNAKEAIAIVQESEERYKKEYEPKLEG